MTIFIFSSVANSATISSFKTKGKTASELIKELTDNGAILKLPFTATSFTVESGVNPLKSIDPEKIKGADGVKQVIKEKK